jgi:hypothetical protein
MRQGFGASCGGRWACALALVILGATGFLVPSPAAASDIWDTLASLGSPAPAHRSRALACGGSTPQSCGATIAAAVAAVVDPQDTIFANGFDNSGSQCLTPADCPATGTECVDASCLDGICGQVNAPSQSMCTGGVCDGNGFCVECVANTDCPATGNQCVDATCSGNQCGQIAAVEGASCTDGGNFCDGTGNCVECLVADTCPDTGNECVLKACMSNFCGTINAPDGTPCSNGACDGNGACAPN